MRARHPTVTAPEKDHHMMARKIRIQNEPTLLELRTDTCGADLSHLRRGSTDSNGYADKELVA